MGVFIALYVAQIVVSGLIFAMVPKRNDLPEKVNAGRDNAIKFGFVPCVGIMLFYQVAFLGFYYLAKGRVDNKRAQLADRFTATGFDSPSIGSGPSTAAPSANPFGEPSSGGGSTSGPSSDNPFV
jgi:hypothetical protein